MKKFLYKITSLILAVIVLFSSLSFTVDMHYCGDTLVDATIFSKAKTCGMEMEKAVTLNTECSIAKKDCCSEKQIIVKGQNELKTSFDNLTLPQQHFLATFAYVYVNLFEGLKENINPFNDYSPPLVVKDIQKLDETYLI